ncbi:MAG: DUF5715 family protein [bacterium]|nr:DUF5715 family protein [bacterium]
MQKKGKVARKSSIASDTRPNELKGSQDLLLCQNRIANDAGWWRMENAKVLGEHVGLKLLVSVPRKTRTYFLSKVPRPLRYLRPGAGRFLEDIARQHHAQFQKRIKITSLVETVQSKTAQRKKNPSAASPHGDRRSLHLTGAAFDISLKPMTQKERLWMRELLVSYEMAGLIDATEEINANCFHIFVLPLQAAL